MDLVAILSGDQPQEFYLRYVFLFVWNDQTADLLNSDDILVKDTVHCITSSPLDEDPAEKLLFYFTY